jgi:hypothetical protein
MKMDDEVEITLKDKTVTRMELTKWLRQVWRSDSATPANCLYIADCLIAGETWRPPYNAIGCKAEKSEIVNFVFPESDYDKNDRLNREKQHEFWELCRRGAEGDAEAAIQFCKHEFAGEVSHGAYA